MYTFVGTSMIATTLYAWLQQACYKVALSFAMCILSTCVQVAKLIVCVIVDQQFESRTNTVTSKPLKLGYGTWRCTTRC